MRLSSLVAGAALAGCQVAHGITVNLDDTGRHWKLSNASFANLASFDQIRCIANRL